MKRKARLKNFENIGNSYWSIIGRYSSIGISPKKPYRSISTHNIVGKYKELIGKGASRW